MSVDPYSPDRFLRVIPITVDNNEITVIEDPNNVNGNQATNSTAITTSPGSGAVYVGAAQTDPSQQVGNTVDVLDDMTVALIYDWIAKQLTSNSPNGLTYEFTASTPTNSELVNSGLTLTTVGQTTELQYDWSQTTINPRFFGYSRGASGTSSVETSLASPISRWGMWQSPVEAHDKRQPTEISAFQTSKSDPSSTTYHWTKARRIRPHIYLRLVSPHVFPYDRADRSELYQAAGLPKGDHNNALQDFWEKSFQTHEQRVIVQENEGESDLAFDGSGSKPLTVGGIEEVSKFNPPEDTKLDFALESYTPRNLKIGGEPYEKYDSNRTPYRH